MRKLYFKRSNGERILLKEYGDCFTEAEVRERAMKEMKRFCDERGFKIHYYNIHSTDTTTVFDVGSHTEFFHLEPPIKIGGG